MNKVTAIQVDEVFARLNFSSSFDEQSCSSHFKFPVPGYRFNPKYKCGLWDGHIRLFNLRTKEIYSGLLFEVKRWCEYNDIEFIDETDLLFLDDDIHDRLSPEEIRNHLTSLVRLPFTPYDHQIETVRLAVSLRKATFLSATGSGKSLSIYLIQRILKDLKGILIVPTVSLCNQMLSDFKKYAADDPENLQWIENNVKILNQKTNKDPEIDNAQFVIGTFQSFVKKPKLFFKKQEIVFVDETHRATSKSIKTILESCTRAKYRIGLTGTLEDSKTHESVIKGLLGPVQRIISAREMIDKKMSAELSINCIAFQYGKNDLHHFYTHAEGKKRPLYQDEMKWIASHEKRAVTINKLISKLKGNKLAIFRHRAHGKYMKKLFEMVYPDIPSFYIDGEVDPEVREQIRKDIESHSSSIIFASDKTFSTGIDIQNLEHVLFISSNKSKITTIQSIGRGLRKGRTGKVHIWDFFDDLRKKSTKNYALLHFEERIRFYQSEQHPFTIKKVQL